MLFTAYSTCYRPDTALCQITGFLSAMYMDWAARAMKEDGSFKLLAHIGNLGMKRSNGSGEDFDLPSWVPDLSNVAGSPSIALQQYIAQKSSEKGVASPDSYSNKNHPFYPFTIEVTGSGALTVCARLRTTIHFVTELPNLRYDTNEQFDALLAFCFRTLEDQASSSAIPPLQALVRLHLPDQFSDIAQRKPDIGLHALAAGFVQWLIIRYIDRNSTLDLTEVNRKVKPTENMDQQERQQFEEVVTKLGLTLGNDFPDAYGQILFPEVDIKTLMGWSRLEDILQDSRGHDVPSVVHVAMLSCHSCDKKLFITEDCSLGSTSGILKEGDRVYEVEHCDKLLIFDENPLGLNMVRLKASCKVVGLCDELDVKCEKEFEKVLIV